MTFVNHRIYIGHRSKNLLQKSYFIQSVFSLFTLLIFHGDFSMFSTVISGALLGIDSTLIRVETDYNEEDVEQLRIRVEAFIELIKYGS